MGSVYLTSMSDLCRKLALQVQVLGTLALPISAEAKSCGEFLQPTDQWIASGTEAKHPRLHSLSGFVSSHISNILPSTPNLEFTLGRSGWNGAGGDHVSTDVMQEVLLLKC